MKVSCQINKMNENYLFLLYFLLLFDLSHKFFTPFYLKKILLFKDFAFNYKNLLVLKIFMKAKVLLLVALSAVIILTYLGHSNQVWDNHTSKQESFIDYKGISGLIRVNFTKFASVGNTIYTGYISG